MLEKKMDMMDVNTLNEYIFEQAAKNIVELKYRRDEQQKQQKIPKKSILKNT